MFSENKTELSFKKGLNLFESTRTNLKLGMNGRMDQETFTQAATDALYGSGLVVWRVGLFAGRAPGVPACWLVRWAPFWTRRRPPPWNSHFEKRN
jgi:hypothetical protein